MFVLNFFGVLSQFLGCISWKHGLEFLYILSVRGIVIAVADVEPKLLSLFGYEDRRITWALMVKEVPRRTNKLAISPANPFPNIFFISF